MLNQVMLTTPAGSGAFGFWFCVLVWEPIL